MALSLVTPPAVEPVSLAEAKAHCRVDITDDDTYLTTLITTARKRVEEITSCALINQTWLYAVDDWPGSDTLKLPKSPLSSVTWIKYTDAAGVVTTYSASNYVVDTYSRPGRVRLKSTSSWPGTTLQELNGFQVQFVAGYGAAGTAVDEQLRHAILLLIEHWYENRDPVIVTGAMPQRIAMTVDALLTNFRYGGVF